MVRLALLFTVCAASCGGTSERAPTSSPPASEPAITAPKAPEPAPVVEAPPDAATPAPPTPVVITDANGCVVDRVAHAASVALDALGKELEENLGRPATAADLTGARCSSVTDLPDLDGDGKPESDVSLCAPMGGHVWQHYVYLSNQGCTRYADRLVAAELEVQKTSHAGLKDVESIGANGCAGHDFTWTRWAWSGKSYRVADTATCYLCSDPDMSKPPAGANRHAYCRKEKARRKAEAQRP